MNRLHIVPGLDEQWNGIAVAAKLIASAQYAKVVDAGSRYKGELADVDEVWVHSLWTLRIWKACWKVLREQKRLFRMLHGNVDPVRLRYHGWKKWLVGPIERFFLRRADAVVATCEAEAEWIRAYEPRVKKIEVLDVKRFFDLEPRNTRNARKEDFYGGRGERVKEGDGELGMGKGVEGGGINGRVDRVERVEGGLHLLYLGRRHPLKGLEYLEAAVKSLGFRVPGSEFRVGGREIVFRVESNVFGEEKEKVWEWCDVLVLPTLSENFGLVVAEALERGKRVITTDGAPAWGEGLETDGRSPSIKIGYEGRLMYLVGYRDGTDERRVELLKSAIETMAQTVNR